MTNEPNGLGEARRARKRAEEELAEVVAQRPEVKEVAKAAVRMRLHEDDFARLVVLAIRRAS